MARTRVKICGITRLEDALTAQSLGVDALGFVFVPASKRYISPQNAAAIVEHVSPFITVVGLFLNAQRAVVSGALELMPQMMPQFHGQETGEYCDGFARSYIKALGVGSSMPGTAELEAYTRASGFLFDSNEPGAMGGTGHAFDWTRLDKHNHRALILAGGLGIDNVSSAIKTVRPYAVDVSSGVESAKGIKHRETMRQFMQAVVDADTQNNNQDKKSDMNSDIAPAEAVEQGQGSTW